MLQKIVLLFSIYYQKKDINLSFVYGKKILCGKKLNVIRLSIDMVFDTLLPTEQYEYCLKRISCKTYQTLAHNWQN